MKESGRKRVTFSIEAPPESDVFLAGAFNDWSTTKMQLKEKKTGVFTRAILLERGRYEYKFIVDGIWTLGPDCTEWVPNGQGSLNNVIDIS